MSKQLFNENIFKTIGMIILSPILRKALNQAARDLKDDDPELSGHLEGIKFSQDQIERILANYCTRKPNDIRCLKRKYNAK
jgi:hypothetical protein